MDPDSVAQSRSRCHELSRVTARIIAPHRLGTTDCNLPEHSHRARREGTRPPAPLILVSKPSLGSCRLEEFDGIARRVLDKNLLPADARHDVIAEPGSGFA